MLKVLQREQPDGDVRKELNRQLAELNTRR
jgi:hypothetical protein